MAGLRHPLAGSLLAFCLLPSRTLHASQASLLVPQAALEHGTQLASLHRHWSADLIKRLELDPVLSLDDVTLPIALLPTEKLDRLVLMAGAMLAGQRLRRCITHDAVHTVRKQLGDAVLDFVRQRAPLQFIGLKTCEDWPLEATEENVRRLGSALLASAFTEAGAAVARRALLRLPVDAAEQARQLPLSASIALQRSLSLLQEIDPVWLSLFPATH